MSKASITPFCAMVLMLISSLVFTLLESARIEGLDAYATMKAGVGIDSVCAEYQPFLWQQYGLLFLDGAYGTEHFSVSYVTESLENYLNENCEVGDGLLAGTALDLFQLRTDEILLEGYALATDEDVFLNYVAEREKESLAIGLAEEVYAQYQEMIRVEKEGSSVEKMINDAQQMLIHVEQQWELKQEEVDEITASKMEKPDTSALVNILGNARKMKNSSILQLIFGETTGISQVDRGEYVTLDSREMAEGTLRYEGNWEWYEKLLVLEYMEDYFSNYTDKKENHFLNYEMEYAICGKSTDWENLEGTLNRILLIREAANVAYLLQDKDKLELIGGLAGIVGLMAGENPAIVNVVKAGIIGAWAYMESVLDVRALVSGEKISFLKKKSEWTTEISDWGEVFQLNAKAKNCVEGLKYVDYLKQILFAQEKAQLAYRMMEVMEIGMRQVKDYENCRMNQMIVALRYNVGFKSVPLFSRFVSVGEKYDGNYYFSKKVERSYIP